MDDKIEFDPIYPVGFHDILIDDMDDIFVLPFANNERRKYLTKRFKDFLEKFSEIGVAAEIWIDGSYSTHKPAPDDIDVVFLCDEHQVNKVIDKHTLISELFDQKLSKIRYNCDVFLVRTNDTELIDYWRDWFSFSRDKKPKGIPRINYAIN